MTETVDARGLSCPQPVLLAVSKMQEAQVTELQVIVDNEVSRENVIRAAGKYGWEVLNFSDNADEYTLNLKRK